MTLTRGQREADAKEENMTDKTENEMAEVKHLIPKADPIIEQVIATPQGLWGMVRALEESGVKGDPIPLSALPEEDARNAIRCIYRALRMKEVH